MLITQKQIKKLLSEDFASTCTDVQSFATSPRYYSIFSKQHVIWSYQSFCWDSEHTNATVEFESLIFPFLEISLAYRKFIKFIRTIAK